MSISLVIGTYNPNKEWLDNAIKSSKGLFDEIIIIDDGSFEPVPQATYRKTNGGFYTARNAGIDFAEGNWIASLDDDDEFIRENVEELKAMLEHTQADVISFPIELFGNQFGLANENPTMADILGNNQIPSGSWFRKSVWEDLKGFQLKEGEDWDFWARAWKNKKKFAHFPKPIYRHRMRNDSMSAQWVGEKFYQIREQVRNNYENQSSRHSDRLE